MRLEKAAKKLANDRQRYFRQVNGYRPTEWSKSPGISSRLVVYFFEQMRKYDKQVIMGHGMVVGTREPAQVQRIDLDSDRSAGVSFGPTDGDKSSVC
jgi:hypothetical protein